MFELPIGSVWVDQWTKPCPGAPLIWCPQHNMNVCALVSLASVFILSMTSPLQHASKIKFYSHWEFQVKITSLTSHLQTTCTWVTEVQRQSFVEVYKQDVQKRTCFCSLLDKSDFVTLVQLLDMTNGIGHFISILGDRVFDFNLPHCQILNYLCQDPNLPEYSNAYKDVYHDV